MPVIDESLEEVRGQVPQAQVGPSAVGAFQWIHGCTLVHDAVVGVLGLAGFVVPVVLAVAVLAARLAAGVA